MTRTPTKEGVTEVTIDYAFTKETKNMVRFDSTICGAYYLPKAAWTELGKPPTITATVRAKDLGS
jgi:hypothetical protein